MTVTTMLTTVTYRRHISRWPRDGGALWVYGRYKWSESATSQWRTFEVIPSDASIVTVYSLQPGSTYMFTVLARTTGSQSTAGLFSRVVNASTKGLSAVMYYAIRGLGGKSPNFECMAAIGICLSMMLPLFQDLALSFDCFRQQLKTVLFLTN